MSTEKITANGVIPPGPCTMLSRIHELPPSCPFFYRARTSPQLDHSTQVIPTIRPCPDPILAFPKVLVPLWRDIYPHVEISTVEDCLLSLVRCCSFGTWRMAPIPVATSPIRNLKTRRGVVAGRSVEVTTSWTSDRFWPVSSHLGDLGEGGRVMLKCILKK